MLERGQGVCVSIEPTPAKSPHIRGRRFEAADLLVSEVSCQSIVATRVGSEMKGRRLPGQLILVKLGKIFEIT